ncbi:MAG: MSMEG_4193 family putative phosphomutase [Candidatus Rokuibacteriota bacterium]
MRATSHRPSRNGARRRSTVVLLVRHATTATTGVRLPGRSAGLHLNDEGRRQADAVAARLGRLRRVAAVYTSPLERARETAAAIARGLGTSPRLDAGLLEVDIGDWTGLSIARASRRAEWQTVQRHPSGFRFPGGESFMELQARVVDALARMTALHPGATVVAVSHADPIKAAVAHALGAHLDLFQRIVVAPASVTAIAYRSTGPAVLTVNSVDGDLAALGLG